MAYAIFGYNDYYPDGGVSDFRGLTDSLEDFDPDVWANKCPIHDFQDEEDRKKDETIEIVEVSGGSLRLVKVLRKANSDVWSEVDTRSDKSLDYTLIHATEGE